MVAYAVGLFDNFGGTGMNIRSEGRRNNVSDAIQPQECSSNLEKSYTRVIVGTRY